MLTVSINIADNLPITRRIILPVGATVAEARHEIKKLIDALDEIKGDTGQILIDLPGEDTDLIPAELTEIQVNICAVQEEKQTIREEKISPIPLTSASDKIQQEFSQPLLQYQAEQLPNLDGEEKEFDTAFNMVNAGANKQRLISRIMHGVSIAGFSSFLGYMGYNFKQVQADYKAATAAAYAATQSNIQIQAQRNSLADQFANTRVSAGNAPILGEPPTCDQHYGWLTDKLCGTLSKYDNANCWRVADQYCNLPLKTVSTPRNTPSDAATVIAFIVFVLLAEIVSAKYPNFFPNIMQWFTPSRMLNKLITKCCVTSCVEYDIDPVARRQNITVVEDDLKKTHENFEEKYIPRFLPKIMATINFVIPRFPKELQQIIVDYLHVNDKKATIKNAQNDEQKNGATYAELPAESTHAGTIVDLPTMDGVVAVRTPQLHSSSSSNPTTLTTLVRLSSVLSSPVNSASSTSTNTNADSVYIEMVDSEELHNGSKVENFPHASMQP